jgi:hypothetical protein
VDKFWHAPPAPTTPLTLKVVLMLAASLKWQTRLHTNRNDKKLIFLTLVFLL